MIGLTFLDGSVHKREVTLESLGTDLMGFQALNRNAHSV